MNEATNALGAAMCAEADANNHATREIGTLILRMTKDGHDWALELNDETPIDQTTALVWHLRAHLHRKGVPLLHRTRDGLPGRGAAVSAGAAGGQLSNHRRGLSSCGVA